MTSRFHASSSTQVVCAPGEIDRIGEWATTYGARALLITGEKHARETGILGRVIGSLRAQGLGVETLEGVPPNPSLAIVEAGAQLATAWRADLIIALGGGSVIDAAKSIAVAAAMPDHPYRDHLSGSRWPGLLVTAALPVVAIPTLPGSGSETNGSSVIVDTETGQKWSAHSDLAAPRIAIIDPELVLDAPNALLAPGLIDAWCHAVEAGLSMRTNIASESYGEQAVRMIMRSATQLADSAIDREQRQQALSEAWWASNLAGQALSSAGSIVTHPLSHTVSAVLGTRHGEAVAALEPAVISVLAEPLTSTGRAQTVARWLDVRKHEDGDQALAGILRRLNQLCTTLEFSVTLDELGVKENMFPDLIRAARASGSRGLSNTPGGEPVPDQLFQIFDLAIKSGPTTAPRELLKQAAAAKV